MCRKTMCHVLGEHGRASVHDHFGKWLIGLQRPRGGFPPRPFLSLASMAAVVEEHLGE